MLPVFVHGFLVLSEVADFCYLCSEYYHPQSEQGIAWSDPALEISLPVLAENTAIQLSAKDQINPRLVEQSLNRLPSWFFHLWYYSPLRSRQSLQLSPKL